MKKIFVRTIALFAAVLPVAGCIEETFPVGSTLTESQVEGADDPLTKQVGAITAALHSFNTAGYYSTYGQHTDFGLPSIHIMTESMLEDMVPCAEPGYSHYSAWSSNQAQGDAYIYCAYYWDCYYAWIFAANKVIGSISDPETADAATKAALGQAYAYRAMFYLDLARLYEPKDNNYVPVPDEIKGLTVPIVTEKTTEEEAQNNPRATRETMYNFILSDLKNAETYLAGQAFSNAAPSLAAVYGLYARTYLEMAYWEDGKDQENFKQAATYAQQAIEASGCTPMTQSQWEDPSRGFNSASASNSWILSIPVVSENISNVSSFTTWMSSEAIWAYGNLVQFGASKSMYDKIADNDFRKHSWFDPDGFDYYDYQIAGSQEEQEYLTNPLSPGCLQPYANLKFRTSQGAVSDYTTGGVGDHPLMRVEEMYFIQMEALLGQHNRQGAIEALNSFMQNYRITSGTYDCTGDAPSDELFLREMLFQKRVEFWGEGILIYDYKRLNQGITRGYEGSNHPASEMFNTNGRSPQWNIVITRGEFQSNTGITEALNNPDPSEQIPVWSN